MRKDNIAKFNYCYGCGVCVVICPVNIIRIELNKEGFFSPKIAYQDRCLDCGLCLRTCAMADDQVASLPTFECKGYAMWSNDFEVRKNCSSGGIAYELGKLFISKQSRVVGVKYNLATNLAEHFIAHNEGELTLTRGSKYIQTHLATALSQLSPGEPCLIVGTPCQMDSVRRYSRINNCEENWTLVDFFCHGVPTYHLWNTYLNYQIKMHSLGQLVNIGFRNKELGWHNSFLVTLLGVLNKYTGALRDGDLFYLLFLGNMCLGKHCYFNCKYKLLSSAADLRMGDLWGKKYNSNDEGVSGVIAFTKKGTKILNHVKEYCSFKDESIETITEGQMVHSPNLHGLRKLVHKIFLSGSPFAIKAMFKVLPILNYIRRTVRFFLHERKRKRQ